MDRIIILGNEPELIALADKINRMYCNGKADIIMYNDSNIGQNTQSNRLFLIGHANAMLIGDYNYPDLNVHFNAHLNGANEIYLSGCSTKAEASQIINNKGFVPLTLADNVKKGHPNKIVYGTPGALVLYKDALYVEVGLASGYRPSDIFIQTK